MDVKGLNKSKAGITEDELYIIPNESWCSPEFPEGCILRDEADNSDE